MPGARARVPGVEVLQPNLLDAAGSSTNIHLLQGDIMIIIGLILLLIGYFTGIAILWTIGVIVLIVGLVLWLMGAMGHAVGGRRHYF